MINRTILVGRLTKDLELQYTGSNIPYVRFTLAVNRSFTTANGDREADFIGCIVWRKQAENMARFVGKGSLVGIEGRIQTGSYDDKDGRRVYTTDVVCDSVQFLEPKGQQNNEQRNNTQNYAPRDSYGQDNRYQERSSERRQQNTPSIDVSEDDLPF